MKKSICAVISSDMDYACQLSAFMNERPNLPFKAEPFSDINELRSFQMENRVSLVLADEMLMEEDAADVMEECIRLMEKERKVFFLCEELPGKKGKENGKAASDRPGTGADVSFIDKYQPADRILREILFGISGADDPELTDSRFSKERIPAWAVWSPLSGCGKTALSLTISALLCERKRVLYVNLEDYHGLGLFLSRDKGLDLSDLIYIMRTQPSALGNHLSEAVVSVNGLDLVRAPASPYELKDVSTAEWRNLFDMLLRYGRYELFILDTGGTLSDIPALLASCERILMPVMEDDVSRAKIRQLFSYLEASGETELKERIEPVPVDHAVFKGVFGSERLQDLIGIYMHGPLRYNAQKVIAWEKI